MGRFRSKHSEICLPPFQLRWNLHPKIRKIPVSELPKNRMKYFNEVSLDLDEKGSGLQDNISFQIDNRFPFQYGKASWEISVNISSLEDDDWNFSLDVVQEYILSDGKLTVIKGGRILLESHPVPTANHELLGAA
jgi:hypothetical protein